ncbi:MAG: tripartite tricarboxylate transporter TctB family protein [Desulfobacteraceae bacterium]|nr:MAG: tripartite tricarboxylate transporter TctB family protein [Desulfobacteraceae bacterium]RPJ21723.1 MAG: tripartite tricarboxylate transporter TctB family protein [Desulfobacteraceae bacterium]
MAAEKAKRIIPYLIILLVSLYFYYLAGQFRFSARPGNLGPDFWPKLLLGLTMVACLYEIIKTAFFLRIAPSKQAAGEQSAKTESKKKTYPGLLVIGIAMTVAYAYFVTTLGFILCTFLYFVLFMIVGRYRKVWAILANSVVGTLVLVVIFMKIAYVSLPLGQEPFSGVTFFVLKTLGIK